MAVGIRCIRTPQVYLLCRAPVKQKTSVYILAPFPGATLRLDNQKYKAYFRQKAKMLGAEETLAETGFAVGGVCPFALPNGVPVFLDESLRRYTVVCPAAGTRDSAVEVPVAQFSAFTGGAWVDVCKTPGANL